MRLGAWTLALGLTCSPALAQQAAFSVSPIPEEMWSAMQGRSWRADLPCPGREELALLRAPYRDFRGAPRMGTLVVARSVAAQVGRALQEIYDSGAFRIAKMVPIDAYGGSDDASIEDNNTSAFNCRRVQGGKGMSKHARGVAIDINPVQNPYVGPRGAEPAAGARYDEPHERRVGVTGLIVRGDVVTRAFARIGWTWGGAWKAPDYQHFAR
ncbi:MAG: family peptidase [Hyphomicrobiales bacterium]|nr:family peptidase [Hyphomicrobiales bacterium]